ncbi:SpoIVB peptidase S55 domain-containing protein [Nocardioides panacisoli]|uniref:Peptidase S55 domain-containing protein n=1 Tax=Nocardioides panacisoli TaxID=627624 RepID=A0ABP7IQR6_9ACTN
MSASPFARRGARSTAFAAVVGLSASLGLIAPGLAGSPAHAAAPTLPLADCPTATPIGSIAADQPVTGYTVSKGTTPEQFTGTVLGVLHDGIGPGHDMIMMELTSPAIDKVGGIWQGMSGSPVYADDGTLIGAVAYGLAYGATPIAGITPYEYMDDYLGSATFAGKVDVGPKAAEKLAATGEVTSRQAQQGFSELAIPRTMSGVRANRLDAGKNRAYLVKGQGVRAGAAADASVAGPDTLVAGGSIAAVQSAGDVTFGGVGTITAICNGRVVAFGHPMAALGDTSYGLGAADVITVQPDPLGVPYKLSNIGDIAGTIDSDRLEGIAGDLGDIPSSASVTSTLSYHGDSRTGETDVYEPDVLPDIAFYEQLGNHDSVIDHYTTGSESQTWVIEGTDENGQPFTINYGDRYQSSYDIAVEGSYPLADTLYALTQAGAKVTSVTSTADVSDDDSVYRVKRIEQKVDGSWVNVTNRKAKVASGDTLKLRALVVKGETSQYIGYSVDIPKKVSGGSGYVEMFGGGSEYLDVYGLHSTADVIQALQDDISNDSVGADVKIRAKGGRFTDAFESAPLDLVVDGHKFVNVVVDGGKSGGSAGGCGRVASRGCRS